MHEQYRPAGAFEKVREAVESTAFRTLVIGMGCVMSVAGGYVAARWARHKPLWHGVGASIASMTLTLLLGLQDRGTPSWLLLANLPLGLLGGYLWGLRQEPR